MELRSVRLFLALAQHRHFARAAQACGISQPAFSARIQGLEQALGVRLVERGARFQRLTDDGEKLLPQLREIVALVDSVSQAARADPVAIVGHLRIAAIPTQLLAAGSLAAAVRAAHPNIHVTVTSRSSIVIDAALDQYETDIGISYAHDARAERFVGVALPSESYALVAADDILGRVAPDGISWAEAASLPLALLTPDMQNRRILDEAFAAAGVMPAVHIESDTFTALMGVVACGAAATILPEGQSAAFADRSGIRRLPLISPVIERRIEVFALRRDPQLPVIQAALAAAGRRSPFPIMHSPKTIGRD